MKPIADILNGLRHVFGPVLMDPDAPWEGPLEEWESYLTRKLNLDLDLDEDERPEDDLEEGLRKIRIKHGAAAAKAHREFLKMVRKDPTAHKRKMRQDRLYRRKHKFHDALMRRTARKGYRRVRSSIEYDGAPMTERDAGQSFMDIPFELKVTEKELTGKERKSAAKAATTKAGFKVPEHYQKVCSMQAFYQNVQYFYRVKGQEWEGSKQEKLQQAIAASYSVLKRSCGVTGDEKLTPSEIVAKGGGELGARGAKKTESVLSEEEYDYEFKGLKHLIRRWQDDSIRHLDVNMPVLVPVRDLWPYREYTWSQEDSRLDDSEWKMLLDHLKGIDWDKIPPLHFAIGLHGGAKVEEGNHRLALAKMLGVEQVPVWFHFESGEVKKNPTRPPPPIMKATSIHPGIGVGIGTPRGWKTHPHVDMLLALMGFNPDRP